MKALIIFVMFAITAVAQQTYTVQFHVLDHATISGVATQVVETGSSTTPVEVVATGIWEFAMWSDLSTENPRTLQNVQGDMVLVAILRKVGHTVNYKVIANGSIEGDAEQGILPGEETQPVTAVPNPGFTFWGWDDHLKENPRTDVNVQESFTVRALFVPLLSKTYNLEAGWNLISVPFVLQNQEVLEDPVVGWLTSDGQFYRPEVINPFEGCWVFARRAGPVTLFGTDPDLHQSDSIARDAEDKTYITLPQGWSLVGVQIFRPAPLNVTIWEFDGKAFRLAGQTLKPKKAYWVYAPIYTRFYLE